MKMGGKEWVWAKEEEEEEDSYHIGAWKVTVWTN